RRSAKVDRGWAGRDDGSGAHEGTKQRRVSAGRASFLRSFVPSCLFLIRIQLLPAAQSIRSPFAAGVVEVIVEGAAGFVSAVERCQADRAPVEALRAG